jgi:hypothetical protein
MSVFRRTSQVDKIQPSLFFDPWAEGALVTEDDSDEPKVLYHGTTHKFDAFDLNNPYANPEAYWGTGFYFSDSYHDVNTNYATTESPDIEAKVETMASRMNDGDYWNAMDLEPYQQSHPEFFNENGKLTDGYGLAKIIARERLLGAAPQIIPVYLKMKKPLNTTQINPTYFNLEYMDEDGEYLEEPTGSFLDLQNAIIDTAYDYGLDGQKFWDKISNTLYTKAMHKSLTAEDVRGILEEQGAIYDIDLDENDNFRSHEFIKDIFRRMGFDGVVMDAWEHWGKHGMRGVNPGTRHYVTWDPTNIKSAIGNNGLYDPNNPIITANTVVKLIRLASFLDSKGRFDDADVIDKTAQNYLSRQE